jgi:hypothetical protein
MPVRLLDMQNPNDLGLVFTFRINRLPQSGRR